MRGRRKWFQKERERTPISHSQCVLSSQRTHVCVCQCVLAQCFGPLCVRVNARNRKASQGNKKKKLGPILTMHFMHIYTAVLEKLLQLRSWSPANADMPKSVCAWQHFTCKFAGKVSTFFCSSGLFIRLSLRPLTSHTWLEADFV